MLAVKVTIHTATGGQWKQNSSYKEEENFQNGLEWSSSVTVKVEEKKIHWSAEKVRTPVSIFTSFF